MEIEQQEEAVMGEVVYANWRRLIKPQRMQTDSKSDERYGKFVIRPLERGFGVTLGNSLRRVLLSSLQGAAISSCRIEGVLHEFSPIPGVVEDVTDIVLNLKGVRLRSSLSESVSGTISVSGQPGTTVVARASDIQFGEGVEVLNPEHPLATLTEKANFSCEVSATMGRGYIPAETHTGEDQQLGLIKIDAVHSPIERVKYTVTNARVGRRTDYDKLTLEIWTDGSVRPEDALAFSAKILKEQLQPFINFAEEEEPVVEEAETELHELNENLFRRVDELELSVRSTNCLQNAGIEFMWQLVEKSESEMLKTKNFGRKSLNEIKEILADHGLSLGMQLPAGFPRNRA